MNTSGPLGANKVRGVIVLGSTGSIGVSALKLIADYPHFFKVTALAAGRNLPLLAEQVRLHRPLRVSVAQTEDAAKLQALLPASLKVEILAGPRAAEDIASQSPGDIVVSSLVGAAGMSPTYKAMVAGKDIALANKETIVAAGPLITNAAKKYQVNLLPVDSEHSAIFQALGNLAIPLLCHRTAAPAVSLQEVRRLILTASGGPFRSYTKEMLRQVTPEAALKHPTWNMGAKITIDSATLMNKGLEVIEATRLFQTPVEQVGVVVHPQSVIHSMVEYNDGSVMAQLGVTDMRGPLAFALGYPHRLADALPSPQFAVIQNLTFEDPDLDRFPCLRLAFEAARIGDSMPAVLNAANEICVAAFLERRISFIEIPRIISAVMEAHPVVRLQSIEQVLSIDEWARQEAAQRIGKKQGEAEERL